MDATSPLTTDDAIASAALLPILVAPHPVLKARCRPVGPADTELVRGLIPRMFASMYKAPGIGLAAPQVGHKLRMVIVDLMPGERREPYVMINPEVMATSDEEASHEEGCLSLPNQFAQVIRPSIVKVRFTDETGGRREVQAEGLLAACMQHEIDHLDGILFVDHISALKRNMILRRLAKEQKAQAR